MCPGREKAKRLPGWTATAATNAATSSGAISATGNVPGGNGLILSATIKITNFQPGDQLLVFDTATSTASTSGFYTGLNIQWSYNSATGILTHVDANGAHQLATGVRSASVAFGSVGEVMLVTFQDGTLYQFDAANDGSLDTDTPLVPRGENVLGLTYDGGTGCGTSGCGTLFELKPSKSGKWKHKILFDFPDGDGGPFWLVPSPDGSTYYAATFQNGGAILSLTRGGGGWTASELYRFTGGGSQPSNLNLGPDGTIFGLAMMPDAVI